MVKADDRKYYFRQIDKAFFISPIVDMEKVILDMMRWADITEEKLREKQLITTGFGDIRPSHRVKNHLFHINDW